MFIGPGGPATPPRPRLPAPGPRSRANGAGAGRVSPPGPGPCGGGAPRGATPGTPRGRPPDALAPARPSRDPSDPQQWRAHSAPLQPGNSRPRPLPPPRPLSAKTLRAKTATPDINARYSPCRPHRKSTERRRGPRHNIPRRHLGSPFASGPPPLARHLPRQVPQRPGPAYGAESSRAQANAPRRSRSGDHRRWKADQPALRGLCLARVQVRAVAESERPFMACGGAGPALFTRGKRLCSPCGPQFAPAPAGAPRLPARRGPRPGARSDRGDDHRPRPPRPAHLAGDAASVARQPDGVGSWRSGEPGATGSRSRPLRVSL